MSKALSDVFDVTPVKLFEPPAPITVSSDTETEIKDDATSVRSNLRSLIETGSKALEEALEVAIESESPRAYEVVTGLLAAVSELNTKLLAAHKTEQEINRALPEGTKVSATQNNVTNNIVFTGTPAELAKLISQQQQQNKS